MAKEEEDRKKERNIAETLLAALASVSAPAPTTAPQPKSLSISPPSFARDPTEPAPAPQVGAPSVPGVPSTETPTDQNSGSGSGPNSDNPTAGDRSVDVQGAISRGDLEELGAIASIPDFAIDMAVGIANTLGNAAFGPFSSAKSLADKAFGISTFGDVVGSHERAQRDRARQAIGMMAAMDDEATLAAQALGVAPPANVGLAAAINREINDPTFGMDIPAFGYDTTFGEVFGDMFGGDGPSGPPSGAPGMGQDQSSGFPGDAIYTGDPVITSEDLFPLDLPGPDDGIAQLDIGELVMNANAASKLSLPARHKLASGQFNPQKLMEALSGTR